MRKVNRTIDSEILSSRKWSSDGLQRDFRRDISRWTAAVEGGLAQCAS
jgi:hypothetical protein